MIERADILPTVIARHGRENPARAFLREVTGRSQTYAEADRANHEFAAALWRLGVKAEDRVVSMVPTGIDAVNVWMGLALLSAITVPVNTAFQGDLLVHVLNNAKARILVCAKRWLDRVAHVAGRLEHLQTIVVIDGEASADPALARFSQQPRRDFLVICGEAPDAPSTVPELHQVAMMMYTSGTTGVSKGVMLPWGAFVLASHNILPVGEPLAADDVMYIPFPLFHTSGTEWLAAVARLGMSAVLREVFSTDDFWSDIREHRCTAAMLVGAMASFIEKRPVDVEDANNPLRILTLVPSVADFSSLERRFAVKTCTLYGSTELGLVLGSMGTNVASPSCGFVRPGYQVRIVDEHDLDVGVGEVGELIVRPEIAWTTFVAYFERPDATLASFRNLWFHTGDAVRRLPTGEVFFVDRLNDTIRRRGENISSVEVENLVLRHPSVRECAAIGVKSELGEEEVKIVVSPRPGEYIEPAALVAFLVEQRMPAFMVPTFVEVLDELPKTPTGKIRKAELRARTAGWERPSLKRRT